MLSRVHHVSLPPECADTVTPGQPERFRRRGRPPGSPGSWGAWCPRRLNGHPDLVAGAQAGHHDRAGHALVRDREHARGPRPAAVHQPQLVPPRRRQGRQPSAAVNTSARSRWDMTTVAVPALVAPGPSSWSRPARSARRRSPRRGLLLAQLLLGADARSRRWPARRPAPRWRWPSPSGARATPPRPRAGPRPAQRRQLRVGPAAASTRSRSRVRAAAGRGRGRQPGGGLLQPAGLLAARRRSWPRWRSNLARSSPVQGVERVGAGQGVRVGPADPGGGHGLAHRQAVAQPDQPVAHPRLDRADRARRAGWPPPGRCGRRSRQG